MDVRQSLGRLISVIFSWSYLLSWRKRVCWRFRTAERCSEEGLTFAAVHDSFWTHAADVLRCPLCDQQWSYLGSKRWIRVRHCELSLRWQLVAQPSWWPSQLPRSRWWIPLSGRSSKVSTVSNSYCCYSVSHFWKERLGLLPCIRGRICISQHFYLFVAQLEYMTAWYHPSQFCVSPPGKKPKENCVQVGQSSKICTKTFSWSSERMLLISMICHRVEITTYRIFIEASTRSIEKPAFRNMFCSPIRSPKRFHLQPVGEF